MEHILDQIEKFVHRFFIGFKTYGLSLVVDVVRLDGLDFKSVGTSWLLSFFCFSDIEQSLGIKPAVPY